MNLVQKIIRRIHRSISLTTHGARSTTAPSHTSPAEIQAIAAYRKTINVYDAFIFFNELETLELRLNILDPYVDFFVIVECTETFSGTPKKLYFKDHVDRFEKFRHKIIHYVIEDAPHDRPTCEARLRDTLLDPLEREIIERTLSNKNVPKGHDMWLREFYQRESIKKALVGLRGTDFCYISDVDEIWNPETIVDYRKDVVYKFRQIVYAYYLNNRSSEEWAGTYGTWYKHIKNSCLGDMRDAAKTVYTYINNGGWHFTNQGGAARIAQKIESYSHQEFNTVHIKDTLAEKIASNTDFVGRSFTFSVDERDLPSYILTHKEIYIDFFRPLP